MATLIVKVLSPVEYVATFTGATPVEAFEALAAHVETVGAELVTVLAIESE